MCTCYRARVRVGTCIQIIIRIPVVNLVPKAALHDKSPKVIPLRKRGWRRMMAGERCLFGDVCVVEAGEPQVPAPCGMLATHGLPRPPASVHP